MRRKFRLWFNRGGCGRTLEQKLEGQLDFAAIDASTAYQAELGGARATRTGVEHGCSVL